MKKMLDPYRIARRGFTLMELLAVIAIIAILVGIVLVSVKSLRQAGLQTAQLNDLRQIALAWRSYSDENDARLLPGYIGVTELAPTGVFGGLEVKAADGTVLPDQDVQSYVWRLAPYLSESWQTFFTGLRDTGVIEKVQDEHRNSVFGPGTANPPNDIGISERPAYGLNSIFVGGDNVHGGPAAANDPWTPADPDKVLAATRMAQVKSPAKIVVFGATARAETTGLPEIAYETDPFGATGISNDRVGFAELRPPYTMLDAAGTSWLESSRWWDVRERGAIVRVPAIYTEGVGLPIARVKAGMLPVVMVDGSTSVELAAELSRDMTRWCPSEVARRPTGAGPSMGPATP